MNPYFCSSVFLHFVQSRIPCPGNGPTHSQDGSSYISGCDQDPVPQSGHAQRLVSKMILDSVRLTTLRVMSVVPSGRGGAGRARTEVGGRL